MARHVFGLDLPPSLPHPTTSFPHTVHVTPAPTTSLPRTVHVTPAPSHVIPAKAGIYFPLCITFDKTELPYYHETMTTQRNHNPRRSLMRETSELPTTSLPHSPTSFPHPPTSFPHPPTSFPRRRESIPLCIAFDKTELPYYPRPMDTPRDPSQRRHLAIPNPPNSPSTESDRMQHNPTRCYRVLQKLVPARDARTRARHPLPSFPHPTTFPRTTYVTPAPTSFPRRRESPRRLQNATKHDRMQRNATKTRARARGIPSRHSRTQPRHSRTQPRHSREGGNPSPGIDRIRPIAQSRRLISLTPIHQTEPI